MRGLFPWAPFVVATAAAGLLLSLVPVASSSAPESFTVDTTIDSVDAHPGDGLCAATDGHCSLRAAIQETNALPGANAITLPAGLYRLTIQGPEPAHAEDESANGDLDVTDDLTIAGTGAWTAVIEQTHWARVIQTADETTVRLEGLMVRGGDSIGVPDGPPAGGGGIRNEGSLTLDAVAVTGNIANRSAYGGGIDSWGPLTILNSAIYDNHAVFGGGGIAAGGVAIVNSTISGNESDFSTGGGIWSASATIRSSTVVGNDGGNLDIGSGELTVINTIIADPAGGGANCILSQPVISLGHNIDSDGSCGLSESGDLSGGDPQLLPLASNGGQTLTHALSSSSPAIDAGDNAQCPDTDQRGVSRPVGAICDIGAFEYGGAAENPSPTPTPPGRARADLNCDYWVDSYDALVVLRNVAMDDPIPGPCVSPSIDAPERGDINCDGAINAVDALVILRYVVGLPLTLLPGCPPPQ